MLRNRFNVSGHTVVVSLVTTTLRYGLLSVVQPIGAALGAALLQSATGTQTVPPYLNDQGRCATPKANP